MGSAGCENETTAPADWANWTPFTLVAPWEKELSEIVECLLQEVQSLLVVGRRGHFMSTLADPSSGLSRVPHQEKPTCLAKLVHTNICLERL